MGNTLLRLRLSLELMHTWLVDTWLKKLTLFTYINPIHFPQSVSPIQGFLETRFDCDLWNKMDDDCIDLDYILTAGQVLQYHKTEAHVGSNLPVPTSVRCSFNWLLSNCGRTKEQRRGWEEWFSISFVKNKINVNLSPKPWLCSFVLITIRK